jgi:hypothetical protein
VTVEHLRQVRGQQVAAWPVFELRVEAEQDDFEILAVAGRVGEAHRAREHLPAKPRARRQ